MWIYNYNSAFNAPIIQMSPPSISPQRYRIPPPQHNSSFAIGLPQSQTHQAMSQYQPQTQTQSNVNVNKNGNCPGGHGLKHFNTTVSGYMCDNCRQTFPIHSMLWGCRICNFDLCPLCFKF